jgi:hypothetical protein
VLDEVVVEEEVLCEVFWCVVVGSGDALLRKEFVEVVADMLI